MAPISCLLNGIPWTRGDTDTLDDLSPRDRKRVLDWIAKNIHFSGSGETYSSYELKHHMHTMAKPVYMKQCVAYWII